MQNVLNSKNILQHIAHFPQFNEKHADRSGPLQCSIKNVLGEYLVFVA